jgi:hypothetical protein
MRWALHGAKRIQGYWEHEREASQLLRWLLLLLPFLCRFPSYQFSLCTSLH